MQTNLSPLDVPPNTNIIGGHLPLKELGTPYEEEEEVLDITKFNFDQIQCKIMRERRKCYAKNPANPISVITKKEIVLDIAMNTEMIALAGTTFIMTTEVNMDRLNRQVFELQTKLHVVEQRVAKDED